MLKIWYLNEETCPSKLLRKAHCIELNGLYISTLDENEQNTIIQAHRLLKDRPYTIWQSFIYQSAKHKDFSWTSLQKLLKLFQ